MRYSSPDCDTVETGSDECKHSTQGHAEQPGLCCGCAPTKMVFAASRLKKRGRPSSTSATPRIAKFFQLVVQQATIPAMEGLGQLERAMGKGIVIQNVRREKAKRTIASRF